MILLFIVIPFDGLPIIATPLLKLLIGVLFDDCVVIVEEDDEDGEFLVGVALEGD